MIEKLFTDNQVDDLIKHLGLPDKFLTNLYNADDWSFIIISHALVESVCTRLLCFHFNEPKIEDIYSSLQLNNMRSGKLGFLSKLELISNDNIKLIRCLSEIRNSFVHDVRLSNISLHELIKGYDKSKLKDFAISFSPLESTLREIEKIDLPKNKKNKTTALNASVIEMANEEKMIDRAQNNPKLHILNGIYYFLTSTVDMHYYSDYLQWEKAKQILNRDDKIF
jgi:hypothetical protein